MAACGHVKSGADKANEYQVGIDVPVSAALTVSGGVSRSRFSRAVGAVKSTGFGLAAKYDLSKRPSLYTGLHLSKNESGLSEEMTATFAVGVQHKF